MFIRKHPFLCVATVCCLAASSYAFVKMQRLRTEVQSLETKKALLESHRAEFNYKDSSPILCKLPTEFKAKLAKLKVSLPTDLIQLCADSDYVIITESEINDNRIEQRIREIYQLNKATPCPQKKGDLLDKNFTSTNLHPVMHGGEIHFYKDHQSTYSSYIYMGRAAKWNGLPITAITTFLQQSTK